MKPALLRQLETDGGLQHVFVLPDSTGELCAAATLMLEPKLLRGGTTVAHICELVSLPSPASAARFAPLDAPLELIQPLVATAKASGCYKIIADVPAASSQPFLDVGFRPTQLAMEIELAPPASLLQGGVAQGILAASAAVAAGAAAALARGSLPPAVAAAAVAGAGAVAAARMGTLHGRRRRVFGGLFPRQIALPRGPLRSLTLRRLSPADGAARYLALLGVNSVSSHLLL